MGSVWGFGGTDDFHGTWYWSELLAPIVMRKLDLKDMLMKQLVGWGTRHVRAGFPYQSCVRGYLFMSWQCLCRILVLEGFIALHNAIVPYNNHWQVEMSTLHECDYFMEH